MDACIDAPALIGDSAENVRILVVGNSGSGKSTTAAKLGILLRIPFISLDHIHWEPGWKSTPNDEFKAKINTVLTEAGPSWVVEGDYHERIGDVVLVKATDVIWLDPPLLLYFPRILLRTLLRLLGLRPPCSPGCEESVSEAFFSSDSILLWCLTHHGSERHKNAMRMREIGIGIGSDLEHRRMRRIGGWGTEYDLWMDQVKSSRFAAKGR